MTVILDGNVRMSSLDVCHNLAQRYRTADTCHILDTDFICTQLDKLQCHIRIIFHSMDRRMGDTERTLRNHSRLVRISDGRSDVTYIVQSAESTCDVRTLRLLHFIKQLAHIGRHGAHAQTVQCTVQHMCLYTGFVERLRPLAHSFIGVLAKQ